MQVWCRSSLVSLQVRSRKFPWLPRPGQPHREDVSYFLQEVPGVLLYIGSGREGAVNELHNPRFLVPRKR